MGHGKIDVEEGWYSDAGLKCLKVDLRSIWNEVFVTMK